MDLQLTDRVAIVGGSSRGIGFAAAAALVREGAAVMVVARHAEELEQSAAALRDETGSERVLTVAADLSEPGDIVRVYEAAMAS